MKRLLIAASAVWALSFVGSGDVSAQHYGCNNGFGGGYSSGYGGGYGSGFGGRYSSPRLSVSVGYGNYGGYPTQSFRHSGFSGYNGYSGYGGHHAVGGHSTWHDTSHLDYHGPSLVPHGGHFDYVPGHYDVHRTGHWDRHGH